MIIVSRVYFLKMQHVPGISLTWRHKIVVKAVVSKHVLKRTEQCMRSSFLRLHNIYVLWFFVAFPTISQVLNSKQKECLHSIRASLSFCLHMKNKYFNEHVILNFDNHRQVLQAALLAIILHQHLQTAVSNNELKKTNKNTNNQVVMMMMLAMAVIPFKYSPSLILQNFLDISVFIFSCKVT